MAELTLQHRRLQRTRAKAADRQEALRLYRSLLVAARNLRTADDQCGAVVEWFVRERYAKHRHENSSRVRVRQGRKHLRLLRRAQCTGTKDGERAMEKVIAYSYGTRGKLKHILRHRIQEVKSRRSVDLPNRVAMRFVSLPPELAPLLRFCETEALKLVTPGSSLDLESEQNESDSTLEYQPDSVSTGTPDDYARKAGLGKPTRRTPEHTVGSSRSSTARKSVCTSAHFIVPHLLIWKVMLSLEKLMQSTCSCVGR